MMSSRRSLMSLLQTDYLTRLKMWWTRFIREIYLVETRDVVLYSLTSKASRASYKYKGELGGIASIAINLLRILVNRLQPQSVQVNLMSLDDLAFHVIATVTNVYYSQHIRR